MNYHILNIKGITIIEDSVIEKRVDQFFALDTMKKTIVLFQMTEKNIEFKVHCWKASQVIAVSLDDGTICPCFNWEELCKEKRRIKTS